MSGHTKREEGASQQEGPLLGPEPSTVQRGSDLLWILAERY